MKHQVKCWCQDAGIQEVCNIPGVGKIQVEAVESKDSPLIACVHIDAAEPILHTLELGWEHRHYEDYHCYTQYVEGDKDCFDLLIQACELIDVYESCAIIEWSNPYHTVAMAMGFEMHVFELPTWVQIPPSPEYYCKHDLIAERNRLAREIFAASNELAVQINRHAKLRSLLRAVDVAIEVEEGIPPGTIIQ